MRAISALILCLSCGLIVISCKKSNSSAAPTNAVTGTYTFVNMNVQSQETQSEANSITAVALANYITKNNTGTVQFTTDSMAANGVGYSVDTSVITNFYLSGTLYAADTTAFTATVPATSTTQAYKLIGTDSLYFPNGGLIPAGLTSAGAGEGARFVVTGDTLKLYTSASDTASGVIQSGAAVITLLKQ
jgi:hypothetical protein